MLNHKRILVRKNCLQKKSNVEKAWLSLPRLLDSRDLEPINTTSSDGSGGWIRADYTLSSTGRRVYFPLQP
jgi:hypothetical protein